MENTVEWELVYDPLRRRLSKAIKEGGVHAQEEIGSFTPDMQVQNLKILGKSTQESFPSTIAIEVDGKPFAPIVDLQGNVRHLLDLRTKKSVNRYAYGAFGEPLDTYERSELPFVVLANREDQSKSGLLVNWQELNVVAKSFDQIYDVVVIAGLLTKSPPTHFSRKLL